MQRGVGEPFAADRDGVALLRDIAALLEEAARAVAGVDGELGGAAAAGELFQRVDQHGADALPGRGRMHVEHVDLVACRRARQSRPASRPCVATSVSCAAEPLAEGGLVIGGGGPGLLLRLGVIVAGQLLDAGAEDFREQRQRPPAETAAARAWDAPAPSSRDLPGGAVFRIFQHDAHGGELVADAVGFLEVLSFACSTSQRNKLFDFFFTSSLTPERAITQLKTFSAEIPKNFKPPSK